MVKVLHYYMHHNQKIYYLYNNQFQAWEYDISINLKAEAFLILYIIEILIIIHFYRNHQIKYIPR